MTVIFAVKATYAMNIPIVIEVVVIASAVAITIVANRFHVKVIIIKIIRCIMELISFIASMESTIIISEYYFG